MADIKIIPMIINGEEITSQNVYLVTSPTEPYRILHNVSYLTDFQNTVPKICKIAQQGLEEWAAKSFVEKSAVLTKSIELIQQQRKQLVNGHLEIGGPNWFSELNVDVLLGQLKEYICQLSQPEGVVPRTVATDFAMVLKQPIGPVLSISPWNAPVILCGRSILAPLAAGCSVITKSHEKSPYINYLLVKILLEAGVPSGALQLVNIRLEDNAEFLDVLLATNVIGKVNFTGSTFVGREIAKTCGSHLVPYLLELGGKITSIVEKDANLAKAAGGIIFSAWAHKGQICMSTDKVYVHEDIYDEFKNELLTTAKKMVNNPDYSIPQRDTAVAEKIKHLVNDALAKGAFCIFGEAEQFKNGTGDSSVSPMIFENIDPSMDIHETESFGPLFALYKYSDKDLLIKHLNSQINGLKASVWSSNIISALNIAKKLQVGGVHINGSTLHDELTIPHGGVKLSGSGRFNSSWGIDEFSVVKTITLNE